MPAHRSLFCSLAMLALVCHLSAAEPAWTGYRGPEGTGVFPGCNPPIDCDMATGRNIRWRTPLPNWGHGCPMIAKDRAYVLSEPGWKHDWPVLTCIDIGTGKVLWEREINHLPATGLSAERQTEVAKQWHDFQAEWRTLFTIFAETVGQGDQEAAKRRFAERKYKFEGHYGGGYGQLRSLGGRPMLRLKDAGLRSDVWRHDCGMGYDEIGAAYATPVSDSEHVYVVASRSALASFDREGKQRWLTYLPFPPELGGYNETNGRSPILYRDLVITDHPGYTVAVEKATGKIRWQAKTFGGGIATPAIITVGGTDVLLTEGHQGKGGGLHALRLPDGKPLTLAAATDAVKEKTQEDVPPGVSVPKIGGWGLAGLVIAVDTDHRDVAFFSSGIHSDFQGKKIPDNPDLPLWTDLPVAVRFTLDGETLKSTVLWDANTHLNKLRGTSVISMVYHRDRLYLGNAVVEALTGKIVTSGKNLLPTTRHLHLIANDRIYGLSGHAGMCDRPPEAGKPVATLTCMDLNGKVLGTSNLTMAPVDDAKREQIRSQVGWDRWGFGYGMPFTIAGDCLYLRSSDELICVGK